MIILSIGIVDRTLSTAERKNYFGFHFILSFSTQSLVCNPTRDPLKLIESDHHVFGIQSHQLACYLNSLGCAINNFRKLSQDDESSLGRVLWPIIVLE